MDGLSPDEARGDGWRAGLYPKTMSAWPRPGNQMVSSQGRWGLEYRFQNRAGEFTWVFGVATRFTTVAGRSRVPSASTATSPTASRPEAALRTSEARYRELAEENARLLGQSRKDAETKAILLHEVNHRVKNNLAAIIGLLQLELRYLRGEEQTPYRLLVQDLTGRIQSLRWCITCYRPDCGHRSPWQN